MSVAEALADRYPPDTHQVVEVTDPFQALKFLDSKASMCNSQRLGDSGWWMLASPSKQHVDEQRVVIVCRNQVVDLVNLKHPYYDSTFRSAVKLVWDPTAPMHDNLADQPEDVMDLLVLIHNMRRSFPHTWITGRVDEEILKVAAGADPKTTFTT